MISKKLTKIIGTISDRNCAPEFLKELHDAGLNVVRLNTAHQTPEQSQLVVDSVRSVSDGIAILVDTKGPEIRTCGIEEKIQAEAGETMLVGNTGGARGFSVSYTDLVKDMSVGKSILIDDGLVELEVVEKGDDVLKCLVKNSGEIGNNKSVNLPGVHTNLPSLSEKDRTFIDFAIEQDIDFIAHSFVRNKEDVKAIQDILDSKNSKVKIIAKIENQEGVDNLEEILDCVYGVMIARGDLGVEIPLDQIPLIQKRMIKACIKRAKPVITATQMLHSMIDNPRPTRAEITDIATAIMDGTDAVMLSGETAYGKYPVEAVKAMRDVAETVEAGMEALKCAPVSIKDFAIGDYFSKAAVNAAVELDAKLILCDTQGGFSPRVMSAYRGDKPIHACTHDLRVKRELALSYGVYASCVSRSQSVDEMVKSEFQMLIDYGLISEDDLVVIVASTPERFTGANLLEVNTAKACLQAR